MMQRPPLDRAAFAGDPCIQFDAWFDDARACGEPEPEACALATVAADGAPSLRMVLLRGRDARGFVFYTHYESRKGRDLAADPRAAMTFYWSVVDRQVRIEGRVERVSAAESDAYFAARPRDSRIAALASPQSCVIEDRAALDSRFRRLTEELEGRDVPRPVSWGGFRLLPGQVEFWQAGAHRLHDRLRYRREAGSWRLERLAP
jgi:pyridoxamine 5'-phosphate oxidase